MPLAIKRGCVILEVLDQGAGFGSFIKDLRLSLVNLATAVHRDRTSLPCQNAKWPRSAKHAASRLYGLEIGADKLGAPWLSIGSCAFLRLNQAIVRRDTSGFAGGKQSFDEAAADQPAALHPCDARRLCHYRGLRAARKSAFLRPRISFIDEDYGMTTFDEREKAFESKFAHDEELRFKSTVRRNKLFGLWAAEKLGLSGDGGRGLRQIRRQGRFRAAGRRGRAAQAARRLRRQERRPVRSSS